MRRFTVLLTVVAVVLVSSAVTLSRPPAAAQEATPTGMAAHPVVGMWQTDVSNEGDTPFTSLSTFHADGTYTEVVPDRTVSTITGVWQPTGERTATVTAYVFFALDDRPVQGEVRFTVEVDEAGTALTEEGTLVAHYEDGFLALAVESPAVGTRLEVLPVEPLGTPVFPPEEATAGTPTP